MLALIDSEWGIILLVVAILVLFGGSQLPKLARSIGSAQSEFKKGLAEGAKGDADRNGGGQGTGGGRAEARDEDGGSATGTTGSATGS